MSVRRRVIHEFCNMFLRGEMKSQHGYVYKSDKRPLYLMDTGIPAMKEYIEGVGTEMFIMRPADLSYVLAFLDFVLNVSKNVDEISIDHYALWATNVLVETSFDPSPYVPKSSINIGTIFTSVVTLYVLFSLIKMIA